MERPLRGILHSYGTGFVLIGIAVLLLMEPVGQHASSPSPPAPAVIPLPSGGSGASLLAQARASFAEVGSGRTHVPSECANVLQAQYPEVSPGQRSLKEACAYAEARECVSEPGWVLGSQNPPFFYLYDFVLTYDSSDQYVLLFGDPVLPSASAPSETWAYRHGNWTELRPSSSPTSCLSSAVADDPVDGYVVYLAGTTLANGSSCPSAGQTWKFHAGSWTRLTPSTAPSARSAASFTNDSADGYLLLFGGLGASGVQGDTWKFSAGSWTELFPSVSPSNRSSAGMTYDAHDGYVLFFGGEGPGGSIYTMLADTWSFQGGSWTELHPKQTPPEPAPDGLTYDPADGYAVYTQVCQNISNNYFSEVVWEFQAGAWSAINGSCQATSSSLPQQRLGEGTTYDASDGYFLLFGGGTPYYYGTELNDTWSLRAGVWTPRTHATPSVDYLVEPSVAYDAADKIVLLFGGSNSAGTVYYNDTWEYTSVGWTEIYPSHPPPAREAAGMVYDASDGYVVLFGGFTYSPQESLQDTWEFVAGRWSQLTPARSPPPGLGGPGMVYDGADGYVLAVGGGLGYSITWTFHAGVWTNITGSAGTPPGAGYLPNPLAYDATDGYVLLFGTFSPYAPDEQYYTSQTWSFKAGRWSNLTSTAGEPPLPRYGAAMAGVWDGGGVALFAGSCLNCPSPYQPGDTWVFSGGAWSRAPTPVAPPGRTDANFVYDPQVGGALLFGGYNGSWDDPGTTTWLWEPGVGPNPFISSFAASPSAVDIGTSTTLSVTALGGTPPLTYAYTGLPGGCTSLNASSLPCTPGPNSQGSYNVIATVTDSEGNVSTASTLLVVDPLPSVASFVAVPSSLPLDTRTVLEATAAGGTIPITYVYSGLPPGCSSQTVPALPCIPTAVGSYQVTVTIVDAALVTASASLQLSVGPLTAGSLSVSAFAADPAAFVLGNSTFFNVTATSSAGGVGYVFIDLPTGCTSASHASLACDPTGAGTFATAVTVSDSAGDHLSIATNVTVYPAGSGALKLQAFAALPSTIDLGGTTVIYVVASGVNGSFSYAYSGLPPGCVSVNVSTLPCTPTAPGDFEVTIDVTDSFRDLVAVRTSLDVLPAGGLPPLLITGFSVPTPVVLGATALLEVTAAGGVMPLSYNYLGLPPGCSSADSASLECHPTVTGAYAIVVTVSDPAGQSANATQTMTVSAPALTGTTQAPSSPFPLLEIAIAVTAAVVLVAIALLVWIRRRAPQTVPGRPTGTQGLTGGDGPGATPPRSGP